MGGDSKGAGAAGKSHDYYGTIAGAVCAGPVDELVALITDGKLIWPAAEDWDAAVDYATNALVRHRGRVWKAATDPTTGEEPGVASDWVIYTVLRSASPNPYPFDVEGYGRAYFYWGTSTQTLDATEAVMLANGHPPYRHQAFIVLKDWLFGRERTSAPNVEVVWRRKANQSLLTGTEANLDADGQANPMAILAEAMTNPVFCAGQANSLASSSSWNTVADSLETNASKTYISVILTRAQTFRSFAAELLQYFDGWLRSDSAGAIEAGRWLHNEAPPTFTASNTIDFHDLVDEIDFDPKDWNDTSNEAIVRFTDALRAFKRRGVKQVNLMNRRVLGRAKPAIAERPWIMREAQAIRYALEMAHLNGMPWIEGRLPVRAEKVTSIKQGDIFKLTHDALQISVACRCLEKVIGAPPSGRVTIRFRSERGIGILPFQPTPTSPPASGLPVLQVISLFQIVQIPTALVPDGRDFHIAVLAARPNAMLLGINTWLKFDDASNFFELGSQRQWGIYGTLFNDYGVPVGGTTVSRARTSNVATLIVSGGDFLTGIHARIGGVGAAGYDKDDVEITLTGSSTFTYPSTGSNESTTADTGGFVDILSDDNSERLEITLDSAILARDIEKFTLPTITEDAVAEGHLLIFLFKASDPKQFEIVSVRAIRLVTGSRYAIKCRRARFGTSRQAFLTGDKAWFIYRSDLVPLAHDRFPNLAANAGTATFRLQPFNAIQEGDLADTVLCPDRSYTFNDPNAPVVTWKAHKKGGIEIVFSVATASRARASNVATIVTGAAHGLTTGDRVRIFNLGGTGYNTEEASVTVTNSTTFTYANTGSDESTTADTAGTVERLFGQGDEPQFSFEVSDASGDLVDVRVIARLGVLEVQLFAKSYQPSTVKSETVVFKGINSDGDWRVTVYAQDEAARVTQKLLMAVGGSTEVLVKVRTASSNTVATPIASPAGAGFTSFPRTITLTCSTPASTIEYQSVSYGASAGGSWTTYSAPFQISGPRTIYARATKGGMTTSAVIREDYWREFEGGGDYHIP